MQLSIQRTQRMGGFIGRTVFFCIDVRAEYDQEERDSINRYKLGKEVIYQSRKRQALAARATAHAEQGDWKNLAQGVLAATRARLSLSITIASLSRGHHIECKDMGELLEAEDAAREAAKNLTRYLQVAKTFNGQRILITYESGMEQVQTGAAPPRLLEATQLTFEPRPNVAETAEAYLLAVVRYFQSYRFEPVHLAGFIPAGMLVVLLILNISGVLNRPRSDVIPPVAATATTAPPVQLADTPVFAPETPYRDVRNQLIASGWVPNSDSRLSLCQPGTCPTFFEAIDCASERCTYLFRKGTAYLEILARGPRYDSQMLQEVKPCAFGSYSPQDGFQC